METEQLEKELQTWNRFMYMALGSVITAVLIFENKNNNYIGLLWLVLQIIITPLGFFLLWGKRWKGLLLTKERKSTIFGYMIASFFLLFIPVTFGAGGLYLILPFGYLIFIFVLYLYLRKKSLSSEEIFP